jgi:hypothetical protein
MNVFSSPKRKGGRVKGLTPLKSKQGHAAFDEEDVRDDVSMTNKDDIAQMVNKKSTFDSIENDPEFKTAKVAVTVLGIMGGIICETNGKAKKQIDNRNARVLGDMPVMAIVTGFNQTTSTQVSATHVPSIPLSGKHITRNNSKKFNVAAVWQTDSERLDEPQTQSTMSFNRRIKKMDIDTHVEGQSKRCMYTAEKLNLVISLMRGSEMITLGTCLVHFTGLETQLVQVSLPVKVTKDAVHRAVGLIKGIKVKKLSKSDKRKRVKAISFKADPSRSYRLDEDASLSILLSSQIVNTRTQINQSSPSDTKIGRMIEIQPSSSSSFCGKESRQGSECSNESDEIVAIDSSTRNILNLPNLGAPHTQSLIDSCILGDEMSTFQKNRVKYTKQDTPKSAYSMSSFSSASFEMRD